MHYSLMVDASSTALFPSESNSSNTTFSAPLAVLDGWLFSDSFLNFPFLCNLLYDSAFNPHVAQLAIEKRNGIRYTQYNTPELTVFKHPIKHLTQSIPSYCETASR